MRKTGAAMGGVTAANRPAMRLYLAHGFRPVGTLEPLREGSELMAQAMELETLHPPLE